MSKANKGPLAGIKILDMTSVLLGPYATQILGDMGADVIKVENPGGDIIRYGGPSRSKGMGPIYMTVNRNKRSLVLDLKKDSAKKILKDLIKQSDVFIHNVRQGGISRLGFDYDNVKALKPDILYVHAVGYGSKGAYEGRQAYDDLVQSASGAANLLGRLDGNPEPRYIPALIADKTTGLHAVYAVLAGLFHRERTGEGQRIEVPMLESFVSFLMAEHLYGHTFDPPMSHTGYTRVINPNRKPYKTKDGYLGIMPYSDDQWAEFFRLGGKGEVWDDPRFSTFDERTKNIKALYGLIGETTETKTTDEWADLLEKANIPAMRVNDLDDLASDEHLTSVGFFERRDHPTEGPWVSMKPPVDFEKSPCSIRRDPPRLGIDGEEILSELGYSEDDIATLRADGVLGAS